MLYNTLRILSKHKHFVILSTAIIALGLYIVPVDHLFTAPSVQAQTQGGGGNGKYGENRFGPPPGHGGQNPGNSGGHPPGNTPGGSTTPPGLQNKPSQGSGLATPSNGGGGSSDTASIASSHTTQNNGGGGSSHTTQNNGNRGH
jgi:hypothetical protein